MKVIAESEAYFVATAKSFYKKGIEMLEKRMLMNEVELCLKVVVLLVILRTY